MIIVNILCCTENCTCLCGNFYDMTVATISEFRANVKRYVDDVINNFFDDTKLIVVSFSFTGISHSGANSGFSIQASFPSALAVENENL